MMRTKFDEQLDYLNELLVMMGTMAVNAIHLVLKALLEQDTELADQVKTLEQDIDQKEAEIEALCIKLLLQQQPVARDLRMISSALKMITDIERIGDQASDISEIAKYLAEEPYIKKLEHIPLMAEATGKMVRESIEAFVNRDLALAKAVAAYDDVVDELFDVVKYEIVELVRADSANGKQAVDLLMIAKYFERIGDHAVNICEWVEYGITGNHNKYQ